MLGTDMHSHLLPGIDDGASDMETSLKLIKGLSDLGYKKLITTPHILWDMYKNTAAGIQAALIPLRQAVQEQGIPVELNAAAEYFLDDHVDQLLKNNEPLLTISGNMVLVELSMAYQQHGIREILFEMQVQGYQPVLAHPERYIYLSQNKDFFDELKEAGCLFQVNILSLNGQYGKSVQELAMYLLKRNYIDLIGTDLHHFGHLSQLSGLQLPDQLWKLIHSGRFINDRL